MPRVMQLATVNAATAPMTYVLISTVHLRRSR